MYNQFSGVRIDQVPNIFRKLFQVLTSLKNKLLYGPSYGNLANLPEQPLA